MSTDREEGAISYHHPVMSLLSLQQLFFVLAVLLSTIFLLLLRNKGSYSTKKRLPPSPSKFPIIGNLHQLGTLPHRSLQAMADKLGPIMLLQLGQVPALVISSVDMAREVMKTQDHIFASRPSLKVPKTLLYDGRDVAFAPYGEYWRQARKLSIFHLLSPKMVRSYNLIREEEVAFMIEALSRSCSSGTAVMNMSEVLNSLAKNIISRTALGKCPREEEWYNIIHVLIHESSKMMGAFHVGDYLPSLSWLSRLAGLDARVSKVFKKIDEILDAIVDDHINRSSHDDHKTDQDFVDILLSLEKETNKNVSFGKENIKAIVEVIHSSISYFSQKKF